MTADSSQRLRAVLTGRYDLSCRDHMGYSGKGGMIVSGDSADSRMQTDVTPAVSSRKAMIVWTLDARFWGFLSYIVYLDIDGE